MDLGARIAGRMKLLGLSQAELARRVGIKQPSINHLIKKGAQGSKHLHRIARVLETTPAYLTGEIDDPDTEEPTESLTSDERSWIEDLRNLTDKNRAAILHITKSLGQGDVGKPTFHSPKQDYKAG